MQLEKGERISIGYDPINKTYKVRKRMKFLFFYVWYTIESYNSQKEAEALIKYLNESSK